MSLTRTLRGPAGVLALVVLLGATPSAADELRAVRGEAVVSSLQPGDFPSPPGEPFAAPTERARAAADDAGDEEGYAERYCAPERGGEQCGPGYGRKTAGGGEKVSHKGWPAVTGILWKVLADDGRRKIGGSRNDELLGHHGSDRIAGAGGKDIIWGDWDPHDNNTRQKDVLRGGSGNDWIYSSHGHNRIYGGKGRDYIWAYYGRGTIDCGPGKQDTVRVRLNSAYRVRNCERIKNFCGHGSKPGGGCYKPGEKPSSRPRVG